jgi:aminoglycoside 3-N-acetyltransferase
VSPRIEALTAAYRSLGVGSGRVILVAANFAPMIEQAGEDRQALLEDHLRALQQLLGPDGTVVVPTATLNLCNTAIEFDPLTTPSHRMGAFSEFVRQQPGARRSFHPFWSLAALGGRAAELMDDVSRHAFGMNSVWSRLIEADALALHVGVLPRLSMSVTHHIELVCGVPYRYTKEFMHPVRRGEVATVEPFYHFCTYRGADLVRDRNRRLFDNFAAATGLVSQAQVARGTAWSLPLAAYYRAGCEYIARNLYAWLEREPVHRPWQS